jgi:hypothetical protein
MVTPMPAGGRARLRCSDQAYADGVVMGSKVILCPAASEVVVAVGHYHDLLTAKKLRGSSPLTCIAPDVPPLSGGGTSGVRSTAWLEGADDLEVLVDEDVVRPVDADVVDLVLTVAQLHDTVDDAARVGGQRGFRRLVRRRSADDRP